MGTRSPWSVAIFAHNVAGTITGCLDSVVQQDSDFFGEIHVLVNGSKDATETLVRKYAAENPNVRLVRLSLADKANAWNHYVHEVGAEADVHFFVDGDVTVAPDSFRSLSKALRIAPKVNAVGALPLSGRSRAGWTKRMMAYGRLAGGLYALRAGFVSHLRDRQIRLPTGLIGEDLFVSCLAKGTLTRTGLFQPNPRLVLSATAGFAFNPLQFIRPRDWLTYGRRLVKYRTRDYQLSMLLSYLEDNSSACSPPDVETLYQYAYELPHYYWRRTITPFDLLAVWRIRRAARVHEVK